MGGQEIIVKNEGRRDRLCSQGVISLAQTCVQHLKLSTKYSSPLLEYNAV
jgi:hypothetical protein